METLPFNSQTANQKDTLEGDGLRRRRTGSRDTTVIAGARGAVTSPPPSASLDPESLLAYNRIRKYLGGCGGRSVEHYFDLFGETRIGTAPFGSDVWAGIRELAAHDEKLRHYRDENIHFGWFQAPYPFTKKMRSCRSFMT